MGGLKVKADGALCDCEGVVDYDIVNELCDKYQEKYLTCIEKRDTGREVDYTVCKNLSSQGQIVCENAKCTWYKSSPTAKYPCMLDLCLMDWDGTSGVGVGDSALFIREQGRTPCPTTHQAGDDLCQMYYNQYQTCVALDKAGRELDYTVCKNLSSQGQTVCQNAKCTWHKNSPTAKYPCMLDMCFMDWDGTSGVGVGDSALFTREAGRPCP